MIEQGFCQMVRTGQGMTNALTSEEVGRARGISNGKKRTPCLLYTSDAADE